MKNNIPKEEPKQEKPFKHECEVLSKEYIMENRSDAYEFIDFDKQETTLEEAAITHAFNFYEKEDREVGKQSFIEGAKWQAEQDKNKYSEEDMIATFHYGHQIGMNSVLAIQSQHSPQSIPKPDLESLKKEWFEQFKNK